MWNVARPQMAPYVLHGHDGEVGAVDWCPNDFDSIATTGDDCTVRAVPAWVRVRVRVRVRVAWVWVRVGVWVAWVGVRVGLG